MIREGKIGVQEAVCLVVIAVSNRVFFTAPTTVERFTGTAGWYMSLIANIVTIVSFTFIYLLLKRFPGKDILGIFNICFGKLIGRVLSFIYAGSFLFASGILLREFADVLKIFVFPKTPLSIIIGSFLLVVIGATFLGLESIARVARLAAYTLLVGFILLLVLAWHNFNVMNLFPIMGYGIEKTLLEGLTRSSAYSEIIILAVFAGSLQGAVHIKKAGYISLILSGLIVSSGILCLTLIFPYTTFQELTAPLYVLARMIKYGDFFQRLDPVFLFLWIISTVIAGATVFYCAVSCYCKTFRIQDTKPVILPLAVLLFTISIIPRDFFTVVEEYIELLREYPILLFYVLPLAALIVAMLRNKKGGEANV